jgi:hypothetical protein
VDRHGAIRTSTTRSAPTGTTRGLLERFKDSAGEAWSPTTSDYIVTRRALKNDRYSMMPDGRKVNARKIVPLRTKHLPDEDSGHRQSVDAACRLAATATSSPVTRHPVILLASCRTTTGPIGEIGLSSLLPLSRCLDVSPPRCLAVHRAVQCDASSLIRLDTHSLDAQQTSLNMRDYRFILQIPSDQPRNSEQPLIVVVVSLTSS